MRRKPKGYVLFVVLIFLQLFALLSLQSLATVMTNQKQLRLLIQRESEHDKALQILRLIDVEAVSRCVSDRSAVDHLKRQPLVWWVEHACHGFAYDSNFYYLRESIATDTGMYYRHSLRLGKSLVQDTIKLQGGREMLRWLR